MSTTRVGEIEFIARINTDTLKKDADETEKIVEDTASSSERSSKKFGGAFEKAGKVAGAALLSAAVAATAAAGKFVLWNGAIRALNIEDAQAKLKGLGHDAKSVEQIMDDALKSVKGTAYGLDAAATAAASAVAAGVKPGQDLTRVLKLVGDTSYITGRDFNEAGAIINKVLASNRLSMEEVNQLQDAGLPILQMLATQYGVNAAELREMVTRGEIDSASFLKAIETNIGGAALQSADTFRGSWENLQAAMSRVGASIAEKILPKITQAFGDLTKWFDENKEGIVGTFETIASGLASFVTWIKDASNAIRTFLEPIINAFRQYVLPVLQFIGNLIVTLVRPALDGIISAFKNLWETIQPLMPALKLIAIVLLGALAAALIVVVGAIAAVVVAATWLLNISINVFSTIVSLVVNTGTVIVNVFTTAWNTVASIFSAVGGWFRNVFTTAWNNIKSVFSGVGSFFRGVWDTIVGIFGRIGTAVGDAIGNAFRSVINGVLKGAVNIINGFVRAINGAVGAINKVPGVNISKLGELGIPQLASGGIVSAPTLAMIGEGKEAEAVIPLSKLDKMLSGETGGGKSIEYNIGTINIDSEVDGERWLKRLTQNQEIISNNLVPKQRYT